MYQQTLCRAIKREISILDYAQRMGFHPYRVGNDQYSLREMDSVRISATQNLFARHSRTDANGKPLGGSIIDFVMMLDGIDRNSAVTKLRRLLGTEYADDYRQTVSFRPPGKKKEFSLPDPSPDGNRRAYAYLCTGRGISPAVVSELMRQKRVYEDVRHNVVFVGLDREGKPGYAARRSTLTGSQFKGDVGGSDKNVAFFLDNGADAMFVCEAPIDALSIMTLLYENGGDPKKYDFLALGGVSGKALFTHLETRHRKIYLCTDNDPAGNLARMNLRKALDENGYTGRVMDKPPHGKDFNEDLQTLRKQRAARPPRQEMQYSHTTERMRG